MSEIGVGDSLVHEARRRVASAQGRSGLWFSRAYLRGTGFHEDGLDLIEGLAEGERALPRLSRLLERLRASPYASHAQLEKQAGIL